MLDYNSETIENGLILLVNEILDDVDVKFYPDEYYKVTFNLWENNKLKTFLKTFKYKNKGNAYNYPEILPQQDSFNDSDIYLSYDKTNVIAVSEKYKSVVLYTVQKYYIKIFLLIDKAYYKKFNKKLMTILSSSKSSGIFNNVDFDCKKKEFIEISDPLNDEDKYVSVQKKKVPKEKLVFDKDSELFNVMNDIKLFFKPETKKLYENMNILYKRGIILHGEPGNGKTAMIREIIRQISDDVISIIINPNTPRVTFVLSELINALKERQAIIIIEDIDAVIENCNRSEFLNILDGVNMKSGVYFIGTTNYPERIDPAFINRSGRFDRSYEIPNPSESIRTAFFRSCKISDILSNYKLYKKDSENIGLTIVELFVKYSDGLSMANLKELMISTQYMLILNKNISIEEALEKNYAILTKNKTEHDESYDNHYESIRPRKFIKYGSREY